MQPSRVVQPHDQRPGLFRVPTPVAAPGLCRPQSAQNGGDGKKGKTHGDGFVHHIVEDFERGQALGNAATAHQNACHDKGGDAEVNHPIAAGLVVGRLAEHHRLKAQHNAQQPQRRQLVPARLSGLLLDQVGKSHHGRQGEGAVANEVGRDMDLHPPAFEGWHQGLDFVRLTHQGVPEQKAHRCTDHQHHKCTQSTGFVLSFVVQVKRRCHPAEHDEDFVQVAHGDVANVWAQLVAFIPAHQGTDQGQTHRHPGHA